MPGVLRQRHGRSQQKPNCDRGSTLPSRGQTFNAWRAVRKGIFMAVSNHRRRSTNHPHSRPLASIATIERLIEGDSARAHVAVAECRTRIIKRLLRELFDVQHSAKRRRRYFGSARRAGTTVWLGADKLASKESRPQIQQTVDRRSRVQIAGEHRQACGCMQRAWAQDFTMIITKNDGQEVRQEMDVERINRTRSLQ